MSDLLSTDESRPTSTVSVRRSILYVRQDENIIIVQKEEIEIPQALIVQRLSVVIIPHAAQLSIRSQPSLSPQFEETPQGYLICSKKECLFIGSYGDESPKGVKVAPKAMIEKTSSYLPKIIKDLERFRNNCFIDPHKVLDESRVYEDKPGDQFTKDYYLTEIASFLKNCKEPGVMIWYSGHGVEHSGDWVFKDGTVSFHDICELYEEHFHGKLLTLVIDCCYSGEWLLRLAEYLTSQSIGACGHCARDKGILIQIFASCQPHESAYDGVYSKNGVFIDDSDGHMTFSVARIEVDDDTVQTPCCLNTTQVCCFSSPEDECNWHSIPPDTDWNWNQLAHLDQRRSISNRCYFIRGPTKEGEQMWYYVLVKSHLVKKFLDIPNTDVTNVAAYGHIMYKGRGRVPPQEIIEKVITFSP